MHIEGATALVTGGVSGLGLGAARMLAANGASVAMLDINEEKGEEALSGLGELRERARFLVCDVSDPEQVEATVTGVVEELGGIGILVNAAGVAPAQRLVSRDGTLFALDLFTFTIGVNLIGMFDVIRNVAGVMAGNEPDGNGERGVIVNVASIAAFEGQMPGGVLSLQGGRGGDDVAAGPRPGQRRGAGNDSGAGDHGHPAPGRRPPGAPKVDLGLWMLRSRRGPITVAR